ncbi:MAG: serine hydrolase, partial [Myxococcota bacterium]
NENEPGDVRDTTTPRAMAQLLHRMLTATAIDPKAATLLRAMMMDATTGYSRLRAGFPSHLEMGDKTGTSGNGLFGNIAFVRGQSEDDTLFVAAYVNARSLSMKQGSKAHKRIARVVASALLKTR